MSSKQKRMKVYSCEVMQMVPQKGERFHGGLVTSVKKIRACTVREYVTEIYKIVVKGKGNVKRHFFIWILPTQKKVTALGTIGAGKGYAVIPDAELTHLAGQ